MIFFFHKKQFNTLHLVYYKRFQFARVKVGCLFLLIKKFGPSTFPQNTLLFLPHHLSIRGPAVPAYSGPGDGLGALLCGRRSAGHDAGGPPVVEVAGAHPFPHTLQQGLALATADVGLVGGVGRTRAAAGAAEGGTGVAVHTTWS